MEDELMLIVHTCKDSENISRYTGKKPSYWVSYDTSFEFTFVNKGNRSDGIIAVQDWYPSDYDKQWKLRLWHIQTENPAGHGIAAYPIELPVGVPQLRRFTALTTVETQPELVEATKQYGESLSPIQMQFVLTDGRLVEKQIKLNPYDIELVAGEAQFTKECKEVIPGWPHIPITGRGVPK
jgi:hypothetical protein